GARESQLKSQLMQEQLTGARLGNAVTGYKLGVMNEPDPTTPSAPALNGPQPYLGNPMVRGPNASIMAGAPGTTPAQGEPAQPAPAAAPPSYCNPQALFLRGYQYARAGIPEGVGMMNAALAHDPNLAGQVALAQKGMVTTPEGGVQLRPGMAQAQGQIAGAEAGAKFPYEVVTSAMRNASRPLVLSPGQQAVSGFSMLPPFMQDLVRQAAPGQTPGQPQTGQQARGPQTLPTATGMSPFVNESEKAHAAELEKQYGVWQQEASNAQQDNLLIDRMKQESQGFNPGKLSGTWNDFKAYLLQLPRMNTEENKKQMADFQSFQKNATQLSTSAARTMGAREPGSVIAMFKNAYPNADLTQNTLNAMFTQLQGLNDYKRARQAAADAWRASPQNKAQGTLDNFQAKFNQNVDPM